MIIKFINLTIRTTRMLIAKWCMTYLEDYRNFIKSEEQNGECSEAIRTQQASVKIGRTGRPIELP